MEDDWVGGIFETVKCEQMLQHFLTILHILLPTILWEDDWVGGIFETVKFEQRLQHVHNIFHARPQSWVLVKEININVLIF